MEDFITKKCAEEKLILKEAFRQKRAEQQRRYRQKLLTSRTPEELEALRITANVKRKQRYQAKVQKMAPQKEPKVPPLNKTERVKKNRLIIKTEGTSKKKVSRRLKKRKVIDVVKIKQERSERLRKKKEMENTILKNAMELPRKNEELSEEEKEILRQAEEIKAKRLKKNQRDAKRYYQNAPITLEAREALKQKRAEKQKLYRKRRLISRTPEELAAVRSRINEKQKERYEYRKKMFLALSPEEQEAHRLEKNCRERLYRRRCKLNAHSKNETPEQRESRRLKRNEREKRYRLKRERTTASKIEKTDLKNTEEKKHHWKMVLTKNKAFTEEILKMTKNTKELPEAKDQNTSNLPLVEDEIKIENEVLQESTIKAIMALPTANQTLALQKGAFNDSSSSWLDLSEKSFISGGKNKKKRYFQSFYGGSSYTQESFPSSKSSRSTKLDRRKLVQEDSFRCMRVLIEATAKSDGNTVYGKQIAQKLRSCKKDVTEINIAKLLVDNILQNLTIGVYNSEKAIV